MVENKKYAIYSLGCKLNFAEVSYVGKLLTKRGFSKIKEGEIPDITIINTCSVTETAEKKDRQLINKIIKSYPDTILVVMGCYAQLRPEVISKISGVDLVLGANHKLDFLNFLNKLELKNKIESKVIVSDFKDISAYTPAYSSGDRTRYFLKVQDGCDNFCTFCTIPLARGKSRNPSIASLITEAKEIAKEGGKEVVLTGVNMGDFGKSTGETFLQLIKQLDEVDGIQRYRISSIEPDLLTDDIIKFVASSNKFAPHFHIPLQSGSDTVLKKMHRRYDCALFTSRIELIKKYMPNAFIGIDVIVGTMGETEELFQETLDYLNSIDFAQLHIFSYSQRPDTQALRMKEYRVSSNEKKERHNKLQELSLSRLDEFYKSMLGKSFSVLFEESKKEKMHGFSENYLRFEINNDENLVNKFINVKAVGFDKENMCLTCKRK